MNSESEKKKFVSLLLNKGILLKPETLASLTDEQISKAAHFISNRQINSEKQLLELLSKPSVRIVKSYQGISKKITVSDFVQYFSSRYNALSSIIRNRQELHNLTSIQHI